ncbi:MAG: hypothetical protein EXQ87_12390 [Alphaproteobacteria bacterium]|nr:hypothetical protein [Alphaproteobacteria bacterium]
MKRRRRAAPGRPIIIHDLAQAATALAVAAELGVPVTLRSAPGAASYLGSPYFRALIEAAEAAVPGSQATWVLDCAEAPGYALGALRMGIRVIRVRLRPNVRRKLADIARQHGARLDTDRRKALDLLDVADADVACRAWLGRSIAKRRGVG